MPAMNAAGGRYERRWRSCAMTPLAVLKVWYPGRKAPSSAVGTAKLRESHVGDALGAGPRPSREGAVCPRGL